MRWLAIAAAVIAAVTDGLYLGIIEGQSMGTSHGNSMFARVPFVAAFIAVAAIAAALSTRASAGRIRSALLAFSASGLLVVGFFAIFSIGLPLLVAGVLAAIATIGSLRLSPKPMNGVQTIGGVIVGLAVVVGGFTVTERMISCPPTGYEGGSGGGYLLTGAYHYSCVNGKLTIKDGACNSGGASVDRNGNVIAVYDC